MSEGKELKFNVGDVFFWMDFTKSKVGEIIQIEITGESVVKRDSGDDLSVYDILSWTKKKEKWQIEKNFAHKNLKRTKKDIVKQSIDKCERFIKFNESSIKEMRKAIKEAKKQITILEKI